MQPCHGRGKGKGVAVAATEELLPRKKNLKKRGSKEVAAKLSCLTRGRELAS